MTTRKIIEIFYEWRKEFWSLSRFCCVFIVTRNFQGDLSSLFLISTIYVILDCPIPSNHTAFHPVEPLFEAPYQRVPRNVWSFSRLGTKFNWSTLLFAHHSTINAEPIRKIPPWHNSKQWNCDFGNCRAFKVCRWKWKIFSVRKFVSATFFLSFFLFATFVSCSNWSSAIEASEERKK